MSDGTLRIIPLGGLGEIGLNLMLIEYRPSGSDESTAIAVDCGLMFPEREMLGIDVVIPDLSYLREKRHLKAVVFTHGHEDHIGALPHLLREFHVPVYGTPFTLGLLHDKLDEHDLLDETELHEFRPRQTWQVGPFTIEGIHITHSIVDAVALAITTPLGTIIHTGDFKFDQTPIDGRRSDLTRLAEWGERGVLLLLSDSTNVERPGATPSERTVTRPLESLIAHAPGKVLVATFASHIHRIRQVIDLSLAQGRAVSVVGKSLVGNIEIARETGHLKLSSDALLDVTKVPERDPRTVTLLTTGSQGEPLSALSRIAVGDHPQVKLAPGDMVILSSRVIPGNERTIARLIDHLCRRGAMVYYEALACVHVSGHACQDELQLMLNLVRPRFFVPIHGEYRYLARHCQLARDVGIDPAGVFLLEDGQVLEITTEGARVTEPVQAGRVFVDGLGGIEEEVLRDRRHMAEDGLVVVILGIEQQTGALLSGPDLLSRGFLPSTNGEGFEAAKEVIRTTLSELPRESLTDTGVVKERVRQSLRRYFRRTLGRRPVVLPFVLEM
ncbi:MAG TPA: ribonuclease J [Candidatus Binatia bacterium]|jgi:ribonuclease J|nr:ribonuclease J [Candidatus Binatia bacterium]